jgi:hypothetical protein
MTNVESDILNLDLPAPRSRGPQEAPPLPPAFTSTPQGLTIGSQLTEFTSGVTAAIRPSVSNSLLLAQLAADKANPGGKDPKAWFATFNTVLGMVGWVPTVGVSATQEVSDRDAELHKAIIPVLEAVLGPAAAAGSIILTVLKGLQSMNQDSPWLTLFEQKSQMVNVAQFGMNYIDGGGDGGAALNTVYFTLTATRGVTQVLFVKLSEANATISSDQRGKMMSAAAIAAAQSALQTKVGPHIADNIANIDI